MPQSTCTIGGCERPMYNKTLLICQPHYGRVWRTGDAQAHIPFAPPRARPRPVEDFPDGTRRCQTCSERKSLDCFHNDKKAPGGKRKTCKECRVAVEMDRHWNERDKILSARRDYRQANLDRIRERERVSYETHREAAIAIAVANAHVRRARMAKQGFERGVTVPALRKRDGDLCHYCSVVMVFGKFAKGQRPGEMATLEHKQAIARGGGHTWDNCVLACWRCNITKSAKDYPMGVADGQEEQPPSSQVA